VSLFGKEKEEDTPVLYPFIMRQRNLDIHVIKVKMKFEKRNDLLREIINLMIARDIDILHIVRGPTDVKAKSITYLFVVNMTRATITIETLVYELKKIDGIKDVSGKTERIGDITIYPHAFPLFTYERAVVLSADFLKAFFNAFYAYFKQPALAASILYQLGIRIGYSLAKEVYENTKHTGEVLISDVLDLLKSFGIGSFEFKVSRFKHGEYTFRLEKSIEAEMVNVKGPRCHLIRGILSGLVSFVEKEYVQVQETKCVGKGDPVCLFVATKK